MGPGPAAADPRSDSGAGHTPWGDRQYRTLLDGLPAGAYTCDADGLITYFNPRALDLWGRAPKLNDPADRFCGSFRLFLPDGSPLRHERCWMALALLEEREYDGHEMVIERPDGSRITVLAHASPIHGPDGELVGAVNVLVDIDERKRMEEELRRSRQELDDFFDNAALGLHWIGPDGIILRANRAELELLGYDEDEYVGHHVAEFHADASVIDDILGRLTRGETLRGYEARLRRKDGSIRHVLIDSNVLWENGQFIHTRCFTRDVTDRKLAEMALREADRRKDDFLATLGHELRNPLAPISHAVEILQGVEGEGEKQRAVEILDRQVRHLERLVDDLLEVSRITRGDLELRRELVELAVVAQRAVEISAPLIGAGGHELTVELPAETTMVDADPVRLAQVLANLLNNAAQHTDPGGRIWLEADREEDEAVVRVRDDGRGIPPERLPWIFEAFTRTGRPAAGQRGGLGIGLAVVKSLVELHGGSVEAESGRDGSGLQVTVRIPLALRAPDVAVTSNGTTPGATPASSNPAPAPRVLIVDDNRDAADSLGTLLRLSGSEVRVVHDGRAALEAVAAESPAVVLLDLAMPGMDGYEVARRVRDLEGEQPTLIALTGWGQERVWERCRDVGFDHHLVKPVQLDALRTLLDSPGPARLAEGAGDPER